MLSWMLFAALFAGSPEGQVVVERVKGAVFTIEVHSGASEARDVLGSGYLVSPDGYVLTNYHVVGAYVDDPSRYQIRVKNGTGVHPARLVRFDLVNDLALLKIAPVAAAPLTLAQRTPQRGESIVSLGNPEGLGLSLIEGVFNGHAEKGFVDRLLLSMPLNSGMSGGPILDRNGEVVGTNVAVIWLANSLSFGVPSDKARALLQGRTLKTDEESLRAEVTRQLQALARQTDARVVKPYADATDTGTVTVGDLEMRRPPDLFDCWTASEVFKDEGVTKARYGCNLQFSPSVEGLGEVGSVELAVDEMTGRGSPYGFYGALAGTAEGRGSIEGRDPDNGVLSAPACTTNRVRARHVTWQVNACSSAFVKHPGLLNFDLVATTVSEPRRGAVLVLRARGLAVSGFLRLTRTALDSVQWKGAP